MSPQIKELNEQELSKFEWLNLQKEMDEVLPQETKWDKLIRKCKNNPVVPIGAVATTVALSYGLWCFRTGQVKMSQKMMRTRVGAQAVTILALVFGYVYGLERK
ncbi:hypothetical protein ABEB36_015228 [Hypothenemus hampei]|uniref:HIG1 domain-containing protein n=1 Tax=Hypothenemus hampei TaxID=57062 RepID=A0ABD1E0U6_HYPHA